MEGLPNQIWRWTPAADKPQQAAAIFNPDAAGCRIEVEAAINE